MRISVVARAKDVVASFGKTEKVLRKVVHGDPAAKEVSKVASHFRLDTDIGMKGKSRRSILWPRSTASVDSQ